MTDTPGPQDEPTAQMPPAPETVADDTPAFDRRVVEALICPESQSTLSYDAEAQELICEASGLAYPIRNGIPIMLVEEARRLDP